MIGQILRIAAQTVSCDLGLLLHMCVMLVSRCYKFPQESYEKKFVYLLVQLKASK
jgi:hypothetical protein